MTTTDPRPAPSMAMPKAPDTPMLRLVTVGFVCLLLVATTVILLNQIQSNSRVEELFAESVQGITVSGKLNAHAKEARIHSLHTLGSSDPNVQIASADKSRAEDSHVEALLRENHSLLERIRRDDLASQLERLWLQYAGVRNEVIAAVLEDRREEGIAIDNVAGETAFHQLEQALTTAADLHASRAAEQLGEIRSLARQNLITAGALLSLVLIGAATSLQLLRRHSEMLARSQERFALAVDGSSDGIWDWDLNRNQIYYSARWKEILGYQDPDIPNEPSEWQERTLPEDWPRVQAAIEDCRCRRTASLCIEFRMRHRDGSSRWILARGAALYDERGRATRMAGSQTDITGRKRAEAELDCLNRQIREASRQAGMAEVATEVLHNVGNVLNSVNVSANLILDTTRQSRTPSLTKAAQLLEANLDHLGEFFAAPNGRQFPGFLRALAGHLSAEQSLLAQEAAELQKRVEHIKQIVAMQQTYAKSGGLIEPVPLAELVEDALQVHASKFAQSGIVVIRQFESLPPVPADRHKTLQILVNLVGNAHHALMDHHPSERRLTVSIKLAPADHVQVTLQDNGIGIPAENLTRIFHHGFTTKKTGHGFGLHSSANAAREMGGSLTAHSDGAGTGATFTLELPLRAVAHAAAA